MLRKHVAWALVLGAWVGPTWSADPNPMSGVDDDLLLGRPKATAAPAAQSKTPPSAEADQAPLRTVETEPDPLVVEADPYATDAPLAPLEHSDDVSLGGALSTYAFLPGDTVRKALERWAREAGYSVVWRADVDFNVDIEMSFPRGTTFEDAAEQTLGAFWRRGAELTGTLYRNRVLVVTERTKA